MTIGWWLLFVVVCQLACCHADSYSQIGGNIVERLYMLDIILQIFLRLLQGYDMHLKFYFSIIAGNSRTLSYSNYWYDAMAYQ